MVSEIFFYKQKAFTLIELLVVIALIGLLASIVVVNVSNARDKATVAKSVKYSQSVYHALGADAVGYWDFNEISGGNIIKDASGNNNNGTLMSGATLTSGNGLVFSGGNYGKALSLDGVDDYVDCGNADSLKNLGSGVTVEAWVKYNAYGGGGQAYSVVAVKGSPWTFLMENPSQRIRFRITAGGVDDNAADSVIHELNRWYHFVGTYDGSNIRIYKDGLQVGIKARTGSLAVTNNTAKIGTYTGTTYNLNGFIDEVRIYSRALSSVEIKKHYAEGLLSHQLAVE
jgi:prepilin-type N-terminal cleavage/methylation domain-containing protein